MYLKIEVIRMEISSQTVNEGLYKSKALTRYSFPDIALLKAIYYFFGVSNWYQN